MATGSQKGDIEMRDRFFRLILTLGALAALVTVFGAGRKW
jgi:hypothetical protein